MSDSSMTYTDKAGQEWLRKSDGWHFDDLAGGEWFVTDADMARLRDEEK